ncbi:hypothetical protein ABKA04_000545 [Annulohypoxylon sp. FPYF3050]
MIWEAAMPRQVIYINNRGTDRFFERIPFPAAALACREAYDAFKAQVCAVPKRTLGYFKPGVDVIVWGPTKVCADIVGRVLRQENLLKHLTSVTLWDIHNTEWLTNFHRPSFNPLQADDEPVWNFAKASPGSASVRWFFNLLQKEDNAVRTIHVFNNTTCTKGSDWGLFDLRRSKVTYDTEKLFKKDSVMLIDVSDTKKVKHVCNELTTPGRTPQDDHEQALKEQGKVIRKRKPGRDWIKECVEHVEFMMDDLDEEMQEAQHEMIRFDYKLSWLLELYINKRVTGLPDVMPQIAGWDSSRRRFYLNWDETDPIVKRCIDMMPKIDFVYIFMMKDDVYWKTSDD